MGWHDHDIEAWFGPVHATLDHIRFPEEFTLPVRSIGLEQCKICSDYQEPVLHRLALVSHLSALLELNLNGSNTEATDAPTRYSRLGGESGKDRPLAGTRGESPRPSASPAVAVTRSGSVRRVRASCTDVRDAVGTTWSMRDRAASTRCPGGSPSRGCKEHGCAGEAFGDVPVPSVRTPTDYEPPMFDLATYGEIDGEPGRYELE